MRRSRKKKRISVPWVQCVIRILAEVMGIRLTGMGNPAFGPTLAQELEHGDELMNADERGVALAVRRPYHPPESTSLPHLS